MEWLGELERAFATNLYPLRVPIAIGLAVGLVAFVIVARRRGWFAAARRHPRRTTALVALLLAVGLPVGWYLGSPLFIRTALVEPAPNAIVVPSQAPSIPRPSPSAGSPGASIGTPPTDAPAVLAPITERRGTFKGADDFHFGSGTARLIQTDAGAWVVRFEDFSVRNGPDLYVYLSPDPDGYAQGVVELGRLKATDGSFNMKVPSGTDIEAARSVVIWCKQFAVQFAVAKLR